MDETYGTYVDDECFDIHDYDDDTAHDTDDAGNDTDDDTNDDADDDNDDGGRGNRRPLPDLVLARMSILEVLYSTLQYCTVLYSTVQYCTVMYSAEQRLPPPQKKTKFRGPFWKYSEHNCPFNP